MGKKKTHGGKRSGAGRKAIDPIDKAVVIAVSLPSELAAQLDEHRATKGWNRSQAVTEAIRGMLAQK